MMRTAAKDTRGAVRFPLIIIAMFVASSFAAPTGSIAATIDGHVDLFSEGKPLRAEEAQDAIVYFRPKIPLESVPRHTRAGNEHRAQAVRAAHPADRRSAARSGFRIRIRSCTTRFRRRRTMPSMSVCTARARPDRDVQSCRLRARLLQRASFDGRAHPRARYAVLHATRTRTETSSGRRAEGEGDLVVWHDRATPWHEGGAGRDRARSTSRWISTQRRIPPHMNKFGKPYGRECQWRIIDRSRQRGFSVPLALRLFLGTALLIAFAVGAAVLVTYLQGGRIAEQAVGKALTTSAAVQSEFEQRRLDNLQLAARLIAADAGFGKYIAEAAGTSSNLPGLERRRDASTRARCAICSASGRRNSASISAILLDAHGEVLARSDETEAFKASLAKDPLVAPAVRDAGAVQRLLAAGRQALSGRRDSAGAGSGSGRLSAGRARSTTLWRNRSRRSAARKSRSCCRGRRSSRSSRARSTHRSQGVAGSRFAHRRRSCRRPCRAARRSLACRCISPHRTGSRSLRRRRRRARRRLGTVRC